MATRLQAIKGTRDLINDEVRPFQHLEQAAREIFGLYGYSEIRTPIIEPTALFARSIGETTDIVSKEMYTFADRSHRSVTLRPEGTAGVVRALLERGTLKQRPQAKFYYIGPMFRYERPQKGRQRQFTQIGCEWFGNASPWADAELVAMVTHYLEFCGFDRVVTRLNNIGSREDRPRYNEALREFLARHFEALCPDCRTRSRTNPMRVFDCKVPECREIMRGAPRIGDYLGQASKDRFDQVLGHLQALGVAFEVDDRLVRGFDYYTHTVFETALPGLGAQDAVLGGGRYDHLVEDLGGPPTPAVGVSFGVERLVLAWQALGKAPDLRAGCDLAICLLDAAGCDVAGRLAAQARAQGLSVHFDYTARSAKAALRDANRHGARFAAILGPDELAQGIVQLKNLADGSQQPVAQDALVETLKRIPDRS